MKIGLDGGNKKAKLHLNNLFTSEKKQLLIFCVLSVIFTFWYCRFIFSPSNEMLGSPITDGYQSLTILSKNFQIFQSGNIPFGAFWLSDFYGGSIATYFHVSIIPEISHTLLLLLSVFTNDFILAVKIFAILTLGIAQVLSFKFAKFYFKNISIAWIFSIGYSFSTFYLSQLNGGHYNFIVTAAILPGVLLLFEKLFVKPTIKNTLLATSSLILLFFGDLQILIFAIYYLILRIGYHFILGQVQKKVLFKRAVLCLFIFLLAIAPFLLSFIMLQNTGALSVPSIPSNYLASTSEFFLRSTGTVSPAGDSIMYSLYVGLGLFGLSIIPMLISNNQTKEQRKNYLFHFFTLIFFILIAIGTPLSTLVTTLFVRVPSRDVIMIVLALCICAGYGLMVLNNFLRTKSQMILKLTRNKVLMTIVIIGLSSLVFLDLTLGIHPVTSTMTELEGGECFIRDQSGDFRVLQYPITWAYSNYMSTLIKHEIVGVSPIAVREYPPNSELFSYLTNSFKALPNKSDDSAGNFTLLLTLCGVKYILIENNETKTNKYNSFFGNSTKYFDLVYEGNDSIVYENLFFEGTAFSIKEEGQSLNLNDLTLEDFSKLILGDSQIRIDSNFNKLEINVNASEPQFVVLTQAYYPYWAISNNEVNPPQFELFLNVTGIHLEKGTYQLDAVFIVADHVNLLYLIVYGLLFLISIIIYMDVKCKKKPYKIISFTILILGIVIVLVGFLENTITSVMGWESFGIFNKVIFGVGVLYVLIGIFLFTKEKTFSVLRFMEQRILKTYHGNPVTRAIERIKEKPKKVMLLHPDEVRSTNVLLGKFIKLLLLLTVLLIAFANVTTRFLDIISWLNEGLLLTLLVISILFVTKECVKNKLSLCSNDVEVFPEKKNKKQESNIRNIHLGLFGGLLSAFLSGLMLRAITLYTNDYFSLTIVLCGLFSGIFVGSLTSGNRKFRGLLACVFGIIAIIFSLIMTYSTPIIIGYYQSAPGEVLVPLYKWHEYTFMQFLGIQLLSVNNLMYTVIGLFLAYLLGSRLSLKIKKRIGQVTA